VLPLFNLIALLWVYIVAACRLVAGPRYGTSRRSRRSSYSLLIAPDRAGSNRVLWSIVAAVFRAIFA